jgi:hypothetical protein
MAAKELRRRGRRKSNTYPSEGVGRGEGRVERAESQDPKTRVPRPKTQDQSPKSQNQSPKTQDPSPKTQDPRRRPSPHVWSDRIDNLGQERPQVEHVPPKTYKFTLAGRIVSASRHTGYGLVEQRKFRAGCRGVRRGEGRVASGEWGVGSGEGCVVSGAGGGLGPHPFPLTLTISRRERGPGTRSLDRSDGDVWKGPVVTIFWILRIVGPMLSKERRTMGHGRRARMLPSVARRRRPSVSSWGGLQRRN